MKRILQALGLGYYSGLFYLVFLAHRRRGLHDYQQTLNLQPLKKIIAFFNENGWGMQQHLFPFWEDFLGNILLFIPFPVALVWLLGRDIKVNYMLAVIIGASCSIELCQYFFNVGYFDIDDILLNSLGGAGGMMLIGIAKWLNPSAIWLSASASKAR